MARNPIDKIVAWFNDHDDGEFVASERLHPFQLIGPTSTNETVLFTTKPQCVLSLDDCEKAFAATGLVGRYGLPSEDDVAWLQRLLGDHKIVFLGDADPPDLLVFAWLRSQIEVRFGGISDSLLSKIGIAWKEDVTILQTESESKARALVAEACPDYRELLGTQCAALWDRGRKLELEAVTVYPRANAVTIVNAITREF